MQCYSARLKEQEPRRPVDAAVKDECFKGGINPSTGIRFLVKFGSLRLPRLTLNAAVCSEIQVPRVMLGGGAKKGSRGGGWAQGRHIVS